MHTVSVFCILISVTFCKELLVEKYTSVEIACPFTPQSWYFDQSYMIALEGKVNSKYTPRYGLRDTYILEILNFTDADKGRYMCRGIVDEEFQEYIVTVDLCNIPNKISYVSHEQYSNRREPERNLFCTEETISQYSDKINQNTAIRSFKFQTFQQQIVDISEEATIRRFKVYKCLTLNAEKCVISNNTYQLNVEWISSIKTTKETDENDTQLYVYTCKCNASNIMNMEENLSCNESIQIYYSNKAMYLRDPENYSIGYFDCALVENNVSKKNTTSSDMEQTRIDQVYILIGGVCGMILVGVLIWGTRRALNQVKYNADNIARMDETQNCPAEGYSSIERRRRIEVGQMVSYKASRVSRSSIANESGHGLVYVPAESSNCRRGPQPEETNGDDNLPVPYLKNITSGQKNTETPILNYIEVEFNTDTVSPKFHIHGSENGTPYANIDHTLKADPLPESDSSEEEDPDNNSEFMTLADIQKLDKPV